MFCMDDMVPQDHLLRSIDKAIDWNYIWSCSGQVQPENGAVALSMPT